MNRTTEHVLQFFLAELGTDGSIDGSHRLARPRSTACKQQDVAASHRLACSQPAALFRGQRWSLKRARLV